MHTANMRMHGHTAYLSVHGHKRARPICACMGTRAQGQSEREWARALTASRAQENWSPCRAWCPSRRGV